MCSPEGRAMSENIDINALRETVGKTWTITDDLAPLHARALAAAMDRPKLPEAGDPLPTLYQFVYFLETPRGSETRGDGHPKSALNGLLPAALPPRRMIANDTLTFEHPLILGQRAERTTTIKAVDHKSGKSGDLVFVTVEQAFSQGGRQCMREEQAFVYRQFPPGPSPLPPGELPKREAPWKKTWTADPVLLFRYSALTLNGHRIHYDRTYAVEKEFYTALVVHGPLLATSMFALVEEHAPDRRVKSFSFRANRPSFDSRPLTACGEPEGNGVNLWSLDQDGFVCVSGRVEFEGDSK